MVDELVRADPRWDGQRLLVHSSIESEPWACCLTSGLVLHLMRWRDFSETRWCGCGPSGRLFIASLDGGMDGLHQICRADPHCSKEKWPAFLVPLHRCDSF